MHMQQFNFILFKDLQKLTARKVLFSWAELSSSNLTFDGDLSSFILGFSIWRESRGWDSRRIESLKFDTIDDLWLSMPFESESFLLKNIVESTKKISFINDSI